MADTLELSSQF